VGIKETKVQYLATGLTAGHGPFQLRGAGIPVRVAGLTVSPGDVIHMDEGGACKFPASKLPDVLRGATELLRRERKEKARFQDPAFNLKKWKAEVGGRSAEK